MKNTFFYGLYIYRLVPLEPTNQQNVEGQRGLHRLCSPPTCKTEFLQTVQLQLQALHNNTPPNPHRYQRGG